MCRAGFWGYNPGVTDIHETARHHGGSLGNSLVYPVLSRRAGGLSIGINLFPERKECSFDCPYCEILPFAPGEPFSLSRLERELSEMVGSLMEIAGGSGRIRDICFSGNGEPTLSPRLQDALGLAAGIRRNAGLSAADVPLRIITNSTGFLVKDIAAGLRSFHEREGLSIWAKLDAGSDAWFRAMSGSAFRLEALTDAMGKFSRHVPITIQTMLCGIGDRFPDLAEAEAYAGRLNGLLRSGALVDELHFYTVARTPADSSVRALADDAILTYMREVSQRLDRALPVSGYGASGLAPLRLG